MRIVVVCTGNIIRSPALAGIMQGRMPQHEWLSAAVGKKAKAGQRMRPQMRKLMRDTLLGDYADRHRSQLLTELTVQPDGIVAVAPVHMKRLEKLAPHVPRVLTQPAIIDPVRGNPDMYLRTWKQILQAASWLEEWLERE